MPDKPTTAAGYKSEQVDLVRATCLYVATKLGDLMNELVVIGGLVPSLLIEPDFAAVIAPGLHLAFQDRERVPLEGKTIMGEQAKRDVWVSGPGAYVVLKSIAFRFRGENKDAYDLYYLVRNYGTGVTDVASRLQPLLGDSSTQQSLVYLREDFLDHEGIGPRRVAEFITGGPDDTIQADVVGFIGQLLARVQE